MQDRASCSVTLAALLDSREARARRQQDMLRRHGTPLLSFTVNFPGPVKDCPASRSVFRHGLLALDACLEEQGWFCAEQERITPATGPEALFSLDVPAPDLKQRLMRLEEEHPLGRLFDLDVLDVDGRRLSRVAFGAPQRQCLICGQPAVLCARGRVHAHEDLLAAIGERLRRYEAAPVDFRRDSGQS